MNAVFYQFPVFRQAEAGCRYLMALPSDQGARKHNRLYLDLIVFCGFCADQNFNGKRRRIVRVNSIGMHVHHIFASGKSPAVSTLMVDAR